MSIEFLLGVWFFLWAVLWAVYFILDGFDLGAGSLLPFIAKNDDEIRTVYNASGPFWDGNEVWLITAGGVTFAAFPLAYAVMFSALYAPLLMLLFALIFRAVAFEFRSKIDSPKWRKLCDTVLFLGSFVPALLLGVAFANLFMGIPIDADGVYHGNLLKLLNPYGLAGGIFFVCIFCMHGALWLRFKAEGELAERAGKAAHILWYLVLTLVIAFLALTDYYTFILDNISKSSFIYIFLVIAVVALLGVRLFMVHGKSPISAWVCSALFIFGLVLFAVLGMFPNIIISSLDPAASITVYNGASSHLTLTIMFFVVLCAVPLVICYQAWVYWVFSHKVTAKELASDHAY